MTGLTEQEREALTIALYGTDFGANGWLGRVECEQFAAAMGPAVESILTDRLAAHEARIDSLTIAVKALGKRVNTSDTLIERVRALIDTAPWTVDANELRAALDGGPA